ncbi:MAG: AAA family ATPase [Bacteroidales bacterium]|nr:AAA family ATPase [Bacteroidales bacterium]
MVDEMLYQAMNELVDDTNTQFRRYIYNEIPWNARMLGLVGPRGVGKSTLLLQRIKDQKAEGRYLYVDADNLYFSNHTLVQLADEFVKENGTHLVVDEVHKYRGWSRELKNIYDGHPKLHVIFTGSSILDILHGEADLSRRALIHNMQGLSFREFMELNYGIKSEVFSLEEILSGKALLKDVEHPLPLFREYLAHGYYPFSREPGFTQRLQQMVSLTLDVDIPQYADMRASTSAKLRLMLSIIAQLAPYKPNLTSLASETGVSKNNIQDYLVYLHRAGLLSLLRDSVGGLRLLGKVEKVYLDNPTLMYALSEERPNIGNVRETFFLNQMRVRNTVKGSTVSDFEIDKYTFEVGGRSKGKQQIEGLEDAYIVKDDIEFAHGNVVPLWMFGLNY